MKIFTFFFWFFWVWIYIKKQFLRLCENMSQELKRLTAATNTKINCSITWSKLLRCFKLGAIDCEAITPPPYVFTLKNWNIWFLFFKVYRMSPKNFPHVFFTVTPKRKGLGWKIRLVLKNLGNSASDGRWNFAFWVFGSWENCQPQVQSKIQVQNPGPKSKSQIQNPKSRGKGMGLGLTI